MTATVLHLPTARSLATIDVARLTDSRTYARGVEYLRTGRVVISERLGHVISATVNGTSPYLARLAVDRHGVDYRCTCPVGADGGFCKHLVALALAASSVELDEGRSDAETDDLRASLATLGTDELVGLLASAAAEDPALAARLARRFGRTRRPADLAAYRRAIEHDGEHWEADAHQVIDTVGRLLAGGRAAEVVDFCEQAVECLEDNAPDIDDDAALLRLAHRLADLHDQACDAVTGAPCPA